MAGVLLPVELMAFAGELCSRSGTNRLHEPLVDIIVSFLAVGKAVKATMGAWHVPDGWMSFESRLFPGVVLSVEPEGLFEMAIRGGPIDAVRLRMSLMLTPKPDAPLEFGGFSRFQVRLVNAYFVSFFDPWKDWIESNITTDYKSWPKVCNFARVVRNAAVHGGTININSKDAPTVSWYSLSYDHRHLKRSIFPFDLTGADIIILMFEMCDELDKIGAPFSAP